MESPPSSAVLAFGGDPGQLHRISGGQETSWRAGEVVLKPADTGPLYGWIGAALRGLPDSADFRLARPIDAGGRWEVAGWSATSWIDGRHCPGRWPDILAVSSALHKELRAIDVADYPRCGDRFSLAMRVAWGAPVPALNEPVASALRPLWPYIEEPWNGPPPQLIHGDLAGNVVFADGQRPGVIDMSPHLAPALFADAIIVADAIAWSDAQPDLARWFLDSTPDGDNLLIRAAVFRLVVASLLGGDLSGEVAAFRPVIETVVS